MFLQCNQQVNPLRSPLLCLRLNLLSLPPLNHQRSLLLSLLCSQLFLHLQYRRCSLQHSLPLSLRLCQLDNLPRSQHTVPLVSPLALHPEFLPHSLQVRLPVFPLPSLPVSPLASLLTVLLLLRLINLLRSLVDSLPLSPQLCPLTVPRNGSLCSTDEDVFASQVPATISAQDTAIAPHETMFANALMDGQASIALIVPVLVMLLGLVLSLMPTMCIQ